MYTFRWRKSIVQDLVNDVEYLELGDLLPIDSDEIVKTQLLCKNGILHEDDWEVRDVIAYRKIDNVPIQSIEMSKALTSFMQDEQKIIGGVYLLSGKPGVRKTMTCKLLTKGLNGKVCLDFNPCKPGPCKPCN